MKGLPASALVLIALVTVAGFAQEADDEPIETGLVEQAERRLTQIDVTVRGPLEAVEELSAEAFRLTIGRNEIENFDLDRVCVDSPGPVVGPSASADGEAAPTLRTLLYFDQIHLTSEGRRRSIELARELIPKLLKTRSSEVMIVSAGRRLEVVAEWSGEPDRLVVALDELANDPEQVSTWSDEETHRVDRMMAAVDRVTEISDMEMWNSHFEGRGSGPKPPAEYSPFDGYAGRQRQLAGMRRKAEDERNTIRSLESIKQIARVEARQLSRQERGRTGVGLTLFSLALGHFDNLGPPRAVVYFADTMRANPGDHYIALLEATDKVGKTVGGPGTVTPMVLSRMNYIPEFQDAIDFASEKGVRLYTVQGRGLAPVVGARTSAGSARSPDFLAARTRFADAENALVGIARETGGKSFLGAADASSIASQILDDLTCLFVFSFDTTELASNRRLPIWIEVYRPGIELKYRPRLIALDEEARQEARLAGAFLTGNRSQRDARIVTIPTGYEKGAFTVLVQFAIPGADIGASDWNMGITAVVGRSRTIESSGRIVVDQPGLPLVFEAEMRFEPGDYEITAVAQNNDHGALISNRLKGHLPDPKNADPFVASVVMLQRVNGVFLRGETHKSEGSLACTSEHWLNPEQPTGILSLVCGQKRAGVFSAVRGLEGATRVEFEPVELDFVPERCTLLIDGVDAGVLTSGKFSFTVDLLNENRSVGGRLTDFLVVSRSELTRMRGEVAPP